MESIKLEFELYHQICHQNESENESEKFEESRHVTYVNSIDFIFWIADSFLMKNLMA